MFDCHNFCLDHERVALGNEEGLFVIHVTKDGKTSFINPPISSLPNKLKVYGLVVKI